MLGYRIKAMDVKLIEKVNFLKEEYTDSVCNIYMNVTMSYGVNEYFLVGRVFKDYKVQGCFTYINGVEKEYKTVKPVLNAIMRSFNKCSLGIEAIIKFTKVEKIIKTTEIIKVPEVGEVTCIDKRVEFTFNTKHGIYRPDLIIKTNNPKYQFIIFEIFNTNAKKIDDYIDRWSDLKYMVLEVNVNGLDKNNINKNMKLLYSEFIKNNIIVNIINKNFKALEEDMNNWNNNTRGSLSKKVTFDDIPEDIQELIKLGYIDENEILQQLYFKAKPRFSEKDIIKKNDLDKNFKYVIKLKEELKHILIDIKLKGKEELSENIIHRYINDLYSTKWDKSLYSYIVQLKNIANGEPYYYKKEFKRDETLEYIEVEVKQAFGGLGRVKPIIKRIYVDSNGEYPSKYNNIKQTKNNNISLI